MRDHVGALQNRKSASRIDTVISGNAGSQIKIIVLQGIALMRRVTHHALPLGPRPRDVRAKAVRERQIARFTAPILQADTLPGSEIVAAMNRSARHRCCIRSVAVLIDPTDHKTVAALQLVELPAAPLSAPLHRWKPAETRHPGGHVSSFVIKLRTASVLGTQPPMLFALAARE
jgi:hypothetical protein